MARELHRLSARAVATLKKPGRHADGGNLFLKISPTGARAWTFFYKRAGRQHEMGLGSAAPGHVSLAKAREKAKDAREILADGRDPIEARRASQAAQVAAETTFGHFADEYVKAHKGAWSNAKHAAQWEMTLGDAYCKTIRRKPIGEIGVEEVLEVLRPVWNEKPETARRIRMRIEKVLDAARVRGLREGENPARWRGQLDHLLPRHRKDAKAHHAAMHWSDVPAFMAELAERGGAGTLAFRFLILTACRTSEVLGARWEEIDRDGAVWLLPAERMKARRPHRVPLSTAALDVLELARGLHADFVFPAPSKKDALSNMALLMQLRRMKRETVTVHGFRSSFRDWVAERTAFPAEVAEMALAHAVENATEAAYRRGDLFEKRRKLMEAWGTFASAAPAEKSNNVVNLK